ncbi:hypothetical protein D9758_012575 [Tetrapyrgos nigripes]|uniref:Uncharacterized protein n=1 Tax=Tetrapyrgos nigripes TaxID=182062 RepID=A0A8H5FM07_9AGAR|nr:hypothetical protein D9758_012575 [Tetrapyrgos nigripes]
MNANLPELQQSFPNHSSDGQLPLDSYATAARSHLDFLIENPTLINSFIITSEGIALYKTETKNGFWGDKETVVYKLDRNLIGQETTSESGGRYPIPGFPYVKMASIETHLLHDDVVTVWERKVKPIKLTAWNGSVEFAGFDGYPYKWKYKKNGFKLQRRDSSTPIDLGSYDIDMAGSRTMLRIEKNAIPILDYPFSKRPATSVIISAKLANALSDVSKLACQMFALNIYRNLTIYYEAFRMFVVCQPFVIGAFVNLMLYTLVLDQTYHYFVDYPFDRLVHKITVLIAVLCDTLVTISACANVYIFSVFTQRDPSLLLSLGLNWPMPLFVGSSGISTVVCQSFMLHRYCNLTKRKLVAGAIGFIILITFGGSVYITASISIHSYNAKIIHPIVTIRTISSVMADVSLAMALVVHYVQAGHGVESRSSKRLIHRLCALALRASFFTALISITALVFWAAMKHSYVYIIFSYCIGPSYSLTLLHNLNIRKDLRLIQGSTAVTARTNTDRTWVEGINHSSAHRVRTEETMPVNSNFEAEPGLDCESASDSSRNDRLSNWTMSFVSVNQEE